MHNQDVNYTKKVVIVGIALFVLAVFSLFMASMDVDNQKKKKLEGHLLGYMCITPQQEKYLVRDVLQTEIEILDMTTGRMFDKTWCYPTKEVVWK